VAIQEILCKLVGIARPRGPPALLS
jgi:hypothetical protein